MLLLLSYGQASLKQPFICLPLYPFPLHLTCVSQQLYVIRMLPQAIFSFSLHFPVPLPCMRPFIPAVFEGQVLTASWHVVGPTMQDCVVVLERTREAKAGPLHHPHQDWLGSGWESVHAHVRLACSGTYAFNTGTDVEHRPWALLPPSALHSASS